MKYLTAVKITLTQLPGISHRNVDDQLEKHPLHSTTQHRSPSEREHVSAPRSTPDPASDGRVRRLDEFDARARETLLRKREANKASNLKQREREMLRRLDEQERREDKTKSRQSKGEMAQYFTVSGNPLQRSADTQLRWEGRAIKSGHGRAMPKLKKMERDEARFARDRGRSEEAQRRASASYSFWPQLRVLHLLHE